MSNSKISNFQRKISFPILLRLVNTFAVETEEYYPTCYKVNDAKISYVFCRLAVLTGAFKNDVDLVLCIIGSD